jgi:UDP-N-acetylglucosamine 2-epimerase (non-hydrolysing)
MSKVFFEDLELPEPDFYLGIGAGSHAEQTAGVMLEFEKVLLSEKPDLVIVVGDVNSTIACSLVAAKLNIKIAHVEAGLRSFDRNMPEEINRILTDTISDLLFVTEKSGMNNLLNEGIPQSKIHFVGNVMIDSLVYNLPKADLSKILSALNIQPSKFILVTLHRPSNVDDPEYLKALVLMLNDLSLKRKIIFPVHPRTRARLLELASKLDLELELELELELNLNLILNLNLNLNLNLILNLNLNLNLNLSPPLLDPDMAGNLSSPILSAISIFSP